MTDPCTGARRRLFCDNIRNKANEADAYDAPRRTPPYLKDNTLCKAQVVLSGHYQISLESRFKLDFLIHREYWLAPPNISTSIGLEYLHFGVSYHRTCASATDVQ